MKCISHCYGRPMELGRPLYFAVWFLSFSFFPRVKIAILAPSHNFVGLYLRNLGIYRQSEKNLLNSNTSSTCPDNMVNFGLLTAEICWRVWGTPANFKGFRVLAALLHSTVIVGISQTLRHWQWAPPIFGRAAITLGIGPHSSFIFWSD